MRKSRLVGIALTIAVFPVLPGSAGATGQLSEGLPMATGKMSIIFDYLCDGVTLDYDTATGIATGVNRGPCSGALCQWDDQMGGTVGPVVGQGMAFTMGYETWRGETPPCFTVVRLQRHTWAHYYWNGWVANSGTWSVCGLATEMPASAGSSAP